MPLENWFPLVKQMIIKVSYHEFKVMNGEFVNPGKCKCGKKSNAINMNCYCVYMCIECMAGNREKYCEKCKKKIFSYEKLYLEPFLQ